MGRSVCRIFPRMSVCESLQKRAHWLFTFLSFNNLRQIMAVPPKLPLNPDWFWSYNSNVQYVEYVITCQLLTSNSIAKDRRWFTEFTPFSSFIGEIYSDGQQAVTGVGTVVLQAHRTTELYLGQSGLEPDATLTLKHVLYVPSARCNIIGSSRDFLDEYTVQMGLIGASSVMVSSLDGHTIAYFDSSCPFVNAKWSESERARYTALQSRSTKRNGPYTAISEEEMEWMTVNYGNEYAFLRNFGLSIHKEEDRQEGRQIMAYIHGLRRLNTRYDVGG